MTENVNTPQQLQRDVDESTPHQSGVGFQINGAPTIVLWTPDGHAVGVPETERDYWIRTHGLMEQARNPLEFLNRLQLLIPQLLPLIEAYFNEAEDNHVLNHAEDAAENAARVCLSSIVNDFNVLDNIIQQRHPNREPDPVTMVHGETGQEIRVDPAQVEHYAALGHNVKEAAR